MRCRLVRGHKVNWDALKADFLLGFEYVIVFVKRLDILHRHRVIVLGRNFQTSRQALFRF